MAGWMDLHLDFVAFGEHFSSKRIKFKVEVDARNINGETPLVLAARQAKINHVKLLIENQVKIYLLKFFKS